MTRFLLMVILAAGLMLGGCAPEDAQTEGAGERQKAEKAEPKNERPNEEEPRKQGADPGPQEKKTETREPDAKKRDKEPAPKPEPPSSSASASASAAASAFGDHDATVTVSRVVDGDTIEVSPAVDVNEEVRLIGMDTPETKDPSEEVEPLGPEASAFATDSLTGQSVGLEFDVEREDQYGRLLAYVWLRSGGEMFNEVLVEAGLAQAYPYDPNTRYEGRFVAAQEQARAAGLGIWGLELSQQCLLADRGNGIGEGSPGCAGATASASSSASASASSPSSASAGSGGSAPAAPTSGGDIDCDQVNGPIPTPPGDPDGLDGDGDGLACE